jgi:hypothetical protein
MTAAETLLAEVSETVERHPGVPENESATAGCGTTAKARKSEKIVIEDFNPLFIHKNRGRFAFITSPLLLLRLNRLSF